LYVHGEEIESLRIRPQDNVKDSRTQRKSARRKGRGLKIYLLEQENQSQTIEIAEQLLTAVGDRLTIKVS
jgi:hypothetical protein